MVDSKNEPMVNVLIICSQIFIASYVLGLYQMLGIFLSRSAAQRQLH